MPTPNVSEALSVDPALVDRFRADLTRLFARPFTNDDRLALAVSGGPDSMAMLALAQVAFPGQLVAATVDHELRVEARDEAAMVATYCAAIGVDHATLRPAAPIAGASVQAQAREVRYTLLRGWIAAERAVALVTAHHADDQAETFLMRAVRGSGVGGLAGIRARRELRVGMDDRIPLLRPLLSWTRDELRKVAETVGAPFVEDPGNADPVFDRARFRRLIEQHADLAVTGLAASAAYAAEAEQTLTEIADREWRLRRHWDRPGVEIEVVDLPRGLRRRLIRYAIGTVRADHDLTAPAWNDATSVEPLLDALEAGGGASQAGVMANAHGDCWRFDRAPPRRNV